MKPAPEMLLDLHNVTKYYPVPSGGFIRRKYKTCKAVDDITLSVRKKSCFGIAGESGSGKSTLAKLILLMEKPTDGSIEFKGKDILHMGHQDMMWYRGLVQTIFQDSASSLSPRMRIKDIVREPLEVQLGKSLSKSEIWDRAEGILAKVGFGSNIFNKFPHELSGGQKQRVAIARAVSIEPELVILDEPVSSLDVSIRAQILNLLADIQETHGLTYVIIAHDLAMMRHITTSIAVMYMGKIVEMGDTETVYSNPMHPYTSALFAAVPRPDPERTKESPALSGEIGNPIDPPPGCRFRDRCGFAEAVCGECAPSLREIRPGHEVACHNIPV